MRNPTPPPIRLARPRLLLSDPVALPLDGPYTGTTAHYDLADGLDFYDHYYTYTRETQRQARNADRALAQAQAQVGKTPLPPPPPPFADDAEWEAYYAACDADKRAVEAARAQQETALRAGYLAIIGRVVVDVTFPDGVPDPEPAPADPASWDGWATEALAWLATDGLIVAIEEMRGPKPGIASGPSGSTDDSPPESSDAISPGTPAAGAAA